MKLAMQEHSAMQVVRKQAKDAANRESAGTCRGKPPGWEHIPVTAAQGGEARRPVQTTVKNGSGRPQKVKHVGLRRRLGWSGIYRTNRTKVLTPVPTSKPSMVCDCSLSRQVGPCSSGQPPLTSRWAPGSRRDSQRTTWRAIQDTQSLLSVQTPHTR